MKKVTILALHMGYGGIEKAIASLSSMLISDYNVTIVSAYEIYKKPIYDIDRNVRIVYLKKDLKPNKKDIDFAFKKHHYFKFIKEVIKGISILKQKKSLMIDYIKNCDSDIIISTRDIYNEWLCKYGNKKSVKIGWEHDYVESKKTLKLIKNLDYFVFVSKEQCNYYKPYFSNCVCIPDILDYYPSKLSDLSNKNIIVVGKLLKEKGYDDLLDVFKTVSLKYPDWCLNIVGGGREYDHLKKRIIKEKLNVILHGFVEKEDLSKLYDSSSICVMTSYKENFGIVLLEAFSYGIPCVAFDRASGAKDLISDNFDGYLVKYSDKDKMARRIMELISNSNRRIVMGRNGSKKSLKFSPKEIKKEWIKLLNGDNNE